MCCGWWMLLLYMWPCDSRTTGTTSRADAEQSITAIHSFTTCLSLSLSLWLSVCLSAVLNRAAILFLSVKTYFTFNVIHSAADSSVGSWTSPGDSQKDAHAATDLDSVIKVYLLLPSLHLFICIGQVTNSEIAQKEIHSRALLSSDRKYKLRRQWPSTDALTPPQSHRLHNTLYFYRIICWWTNEPPPPGDN